MNPKLPAGPPTATDSLVTVQDLGRRHPDGSRWLFHEIGFEVRPGDRLALVGPTGSGKSLVLRAVALLDPVDQGTIDWCGEAVADSCVPEYRSRVLYLQQRSPLLEGTVEDNLRMPFSLRVRKHRSFERQPVDDLLRDLGRQGNLLAQRTTELSGGERQLVALLRALLCEPTVLLLDEPSAALDPESTAALERCVQGWYSAASTDRAYIWVSHDPAQASRVSDRILNLEGGRLQEAR